jgi:hypothetical protein
MRISIRSLNSNLSFQALMNVMIFLIIELVDIDYGLRIIRSN